MLGVSRQYMVRLLEEGKLPFHGGIQLGLGELLMALGRGIPRFVEVVRVVTGDSEFGSEVFDCLKQ